MIATVVVVVDESGYGHFQFTWHFIRDLVHFLLDTLVVPFQLPVGLGMVSGRQDVRLREGRLVAVRPRPKYAPLFAYALWRQHVAGGARSS